MKTKTQSLQAQKEHLYKILNTFPESDFHAVKSFAEFIKKARKEKDFNLLRVLLNVPYEEKELSEQTKKDIRKSESEFKKGKVKTLKEVKKALGL
jgi:hypothetical protein